MPVFNQYNFNETEELKLIVAGDEAAFERLYLNYRQKAFTIALTYIKSPAEVEDVLQEFFLKLWRNRSALEHVREMDQYFFIMLRNMLVSELRTRERQSKIVQYINQVEIDPPSSVHKEDLNDLNQIIFEALEQLPEKQQRIYQLSREEGLTHEEIGEIFNLSHRTISNHMSLTLSHLRAILRREGYYISIAIISFLIFC